MYSKVEAVLQNAAIGVNVSCADVKDIVEHFGKDHQDADLRTELAMLKNTMQGIEFSVTNLKEKLSVYRQLFPQVSKLFRLLLTMPATSATSERSFHHFAKSRPTYVQL